MPANSRKDPFEHALNQLLDYGLEVEVLLTDGQLRRVRHQEDKPGKKDGWYVAHEVVSKAGNRYVVGAYGWWKDDQTHKIEFDGSGLSEDERQQLTEKRREAERQARESRQHKAAEAAERAAEIWPGLPDSGGSEYLRRKGVGAYGLRFARGQVVVPVRRVDGALVGLQWISADGAKRFLTGTAKQGAFHLLGEIAPDLPLAIAEGYATAATVHALTGWPCAVAFDAGNLKPVALALSEQGGYARLLICADDDHGTQGNPGRHKAELAAGQTGATVLLPPFAAGDTGTDWNDFCGSSGHEATRAALLAGLQQKEVVQVAEEKPEDKPDLRVVAGTEHDPRPIVQLKNGELSHNTDDAEQALLDEGVDVYQHGNRLVRVGAWEGAKGPVSRPSGSGVLIDISPEWLVDAMTRAIQWRRYDKRKADWVRADCPTKVAKTLLARSGEWRFPHLTGFCDAPTMTTDGRIVSKPGYDDESGLYLTNPPEIPPINKPTRKDAQVACDTLYELVSTFPYVTKADRSAALAILMTALLRRSLPSAPIGGISASTPGTGKSLFADCVSVLATGRKASAVALGKDGEEMEKRLDSVLLKGDTICVWDNVDRAVKSDVLCQVTTQQHKSVRFLGQSKIVESPTNVTQIMTGNNLTLIGDLTRRAVMMHLDAGCERPERREFSRDAIEHMLKFRSEGIHAALTISSAYLAAGAPAVKSTPFGSFEDWDRLIRRALIWAGWPDPLQPAENLREQDHEFVGMSDFMAAWLELFGDTKLTASDLTERINEREPTYAGGTGGFRYPALTEAAMTVMGDLRKWGVKELGYRLRQWSERIIDGRRVMNAGKGKHGARWQVEKVG